MAYMRLSVAILVVALAATSASARITMELNLAHLNEDAPLREAKCKMTNSYPPPANTALNWTTISLDDPAETRWSHIVTPQASRIRAMIQGVIDLLPEKFRENLLAYLAKHSENVADAMPAPYGDEIRGIAKATNIPLGELILFNVAYELEGVCTSIVAEDSNGNMWHARNLDFGLFLGVDTNTTHTWAWALAERLRPLLFNARVMKGGVNVYNITGFAGYVGLLTGVKAGGFSISVDTRFDDNLDKGLFKWFEGDHSAHFLTFTTRDVMENNSTYDEAASSLQSIKLIGPGYIILGGPKSGQGVIITREEEKNLHPLFLADKIKNQTFYILQTNYDHWVQPPFFDDRRGPGMACMDELGPGHTGMAGLFNVLSGRPNLNMLTTYTTVASITTGEFEAYTQDCEWPCAPW